MSDINWKDGAVCYANAAQIFSGLLDDDLLSRCLTFNDFQLNEIREGDYIPASELDTEQKYNDVVEALKLHGVTGGLVEDKYSYQDIVGMFSDDKFIAIHNVENEVCAGFVNDGSFCKRKMFFDQIIAIGKLKRMMLERENKSVDCEFYRNFDSNPFKLDEFSEVSTTKLFKDIKFSETLEEKPKRRNKSKQAYDILKSLDYEYDLVKQRWFKKQYID